MADGVGEMRREGPAWARQNPDVAFTACHIWFSLIRKVLDYSFRFAIEANHACSWPTVRAATQPTLVARVSSDQPSNQTPSRDYKRAALDNDNGLSEVCGRLGDRKRTALPLFLWRQG